MNPFTLLVSFIFILICLGIIDIIETKLLIDKLSEKHPNIIKKYGVKKGWRLFALDQRLQNIKTLKLLFSDDLGAIDDSAIQKMVKIIKVLFFFQIFVGIFGGVWLFILK